jgi:hypothetical protein
MSDRKPFTDLTAAFGEERRCAVEATKKQILDDLAATRPAS